MYRPGFLRCIVALGLVFLDSGIAPGQDDPEPLRLEGLYPIGARASVTEAWGTLVCTVQNLTDSAKLARVVVFYTTQPEIQYSRELWVPPHSRRTSWLSVGPAPPQTANLSRELAFQLFDRTDGVDRAVRQRDPERLLTRSLLYSPREATTALYLDPLETETGAADSLSNPESADSESLRLVQTFRETRLLSDRVSIVRERFLPPVSEAFGGIEHFVVAGKGLAADPAGARALRHWVLNGGTLWVLIDRVAPDVVAPILGEGLRFQIADRTSLTTVRFRGAKADRKLFEKFDFDRPVDLVRVSLSGSETVLTEVNDWPAAFVQPMGRGRIFFTTLGARAWYRPRLKGDPRSRFERLPDLPYAQASLYSLAWQIQPEREVLGVPLEALAPLLTAEIGYEVVGRQTAAFLLAAFLVGLVVVVVVLRRSRTPELIGIGAPAVAVVVAMAFAAAGMNSRQSVPRTAAAVALVSVSPDSGEEQWRGLFALYNQESGPVELSTHRGGQVDIDQSGLEGTRRRVETDLDAWHWDNLSFPAGVRMGPFHSTARTSISAVARFGPTGLDGQLHLGSSRNSFDGVIQTRSGAVLAVHWNADGSFHVDSTDLLPPDQYIPGAVLTDRQQRRQDLYRKYFAGSQAEGAPERDRLFVWTESTEIPFDVPGAARTLATALCIIPIQYESAGSEAAVHVPNGFLPYVAISNGRSHPPTLQNKEPVQLHLRFQMPDHLRRFTLDRAVFQARVHAPGRKFSLFGSGDSTDDRAGNPVPIHAQLNPGGLVRIDIADPKLLHADADGGLYLDLVVSERIGPDGRENPVKVTENQLMWEIEAIGLEVFGRGAGR